jgi:hypothetical protein
MAKMVHEIHSFCQRHDTFADMMLIPPVPINPANMWHANVSKGASNSRSVEYAYALGSLARRLHAHYRQESASVGAGGGIRSVRFANCWDAMTRAMRDKENFARLFTWVFILVSARWNERARADRQRWLSPCTGWLPGYSQELARDWLLQRMSGIG